MSKSGGRGRGWLNLQKNQQNVSPNPAPIRLKDAMKALNEANSFNNICGYKDLIRRVKDLDLNDDGIKFNQKIKYILESWKQAYHTSEEVEKSFDALYQGCLNDAELASKVVIMIASRSFIYQQVHDQNIRLIFLKKLQNDFEGCKILQKTNATGFRNSVKMLGEFYNKARLANGQRFTFMLSPLLSYLEMLLESGEVLDLQQFAAQIFLNGSALKTECSDKLNNLLNNIRLLLASDKKIPGEGKLWLLFSLEIAGNKFGILPIEIYKFYQEQIGSNAVDIFGEAQNTLVVQTTEDNKALENYQSNVNILQLSTKPDLPVCTEPNVSTPANNSEVNCTFINTSGFSSDTSSQNSSSTKESTTSSGKFGRPILGAGARLIKNKSNETESNNWKEPGEKPNSGWAKPGGTGRREKASNKDALTKNKAWDQEDRIENDYS